jgi:hypothetical protein
MLNAILQARRDAEASVEERRAAEKEAAHIELVGQTNQARAEM